MKLLAFDGNLRVGGCCAKPANRVRLASAADILAWLESEEFEMTAEVLKRESFKMEENVD